jgi:hypothetical protein
VRNDLPVAKDGSFWVRLCLQTLVARLTLGRTWPFLVMKQVWQQETLD